MEMLLPSRLKWVFLLCSALVGLLTVRQYVGIDKAVSVGSFVDTSRLMLQTRNQTKRNTKSNASSTFPAVPSAPLMVEPTDTATRSRDAPASPSPSARFRVVPSSPTTNVPQLQATHAAPRSVPRERAVRPGQQMAKRNVDCYRHRDRGLMALLEASKREFCSDAKLDRKHTRVVLYDAAGTGVQAAVLQRFRLDLQYTSVAHDIVRIAQDGGGHDPRFKYTDRLIHCDCPAFAAYARTAPESAYASIWNPQLDRVPSKANGAICASPWLAGVNASNEVRLTQPVVLLSRRDDHNPFFQISAALNAWILLRTLKWPTEAVQLVYLDAGIPSPMHELQHRLLAPSHRVVALNEYRKAGPTVIRFDGPVVVAPFETNGPMMQHLDDDEPCGASMLFKDFRRAAMEAMAVSESEARKASDTFLVTIISRRTYQGRRVQRQWVNEAEILREMDREFGGKDTVAPQIEVKFQSVDPVRLPLKQQMELMVASNLIIGMHGAGMANIFWTRPTTTVIEIFPKRRFRWGYRNLCQFLGCDWHEFRGGLDTGRGDNASDKKVPYHEWRRFFAPLLRQAVATWRS